MEHVSVEKSRHSKSNQKHVLWFIHVSVPFIVKSQSQYRGVQGYDSMGSVLRVSAPGEPIREPWCW